MGAACSAATPEEPHEFFRGQHAVTDMTAAGSGGRNHAAGVAEWQSGKDKAREWQKQIKAEIRQLDRDMNQIRREEEKLKRELKTLANGGQYEKVKSTAQNVVRLRRSVARLEKTKNSMTAMNLSLTTQVATMASASAVKVSTSMMKEANQLLNVQEMQRTLDEMQREMAKAQFANEAIEEGFSDSEDETEIDTELKKVFDEVALDASLLIRAGPPTRLVPESAPLRDGVAEQRSPTGAGEAHASRL